MQSKIKPALKKFKFLAGFDPQIIRQSNSHLFIPEQFKSIVLISADFELAWAWRFTKKSSVPLILAVELAKQERQNTPLILDISEKYNIPITWATVGHLFLNSCARKNGIVHPDIPRLQHFENVFWKFSKGDWFDSDPCSALKDSPEWYCPDLILRIISSSVKHEIGNHTFSHIDCRDEVCPPEVFRAEIRESKKLASEFGLELKSFVHPGHTIGNLNTLAEEGFTNFRTDYRNVLGYPKKHNNGLWEFEQTMEFRYYDYWSIDFQIKRYIRIIKRAIQSNTVCVLWFHPSFHPWVIEKIWPEVFDFLDKHRGDIWITTHSEYVNWLNKRGNEG